MHRRNNLSKSTKRRRLLAENNYIKTLSHNDSFITSPSVTLNDTSTIVTNNPLIEPTTNYTDVDNHVKYKVEIGPNNVKRKRKTECLNSDLVQPSNFKSLTITILLRNINN